MGKPFVFAELFSDYVFYEGFPAGTYPDKNGNPLNYLGKFQGLVKINEGSKDETTLYEGNYNDGKKEGLFTLKSTVYEGVVFKEENYKDDQLNGEKKVWNFIPKANATAKEYRILVEKTLYEQGEVTAEKTLPNGERREIREVIERKKVDLATFYKQHDGAFNSSMNESRKIVREPGCGVIVLDKKENEQGNKHSYSIAISNKHTIKNRNEEWVWDKDSEDYTCSSKYGFF